MIIGLGIFVTGGFVDSLITMFLCTSLGALTFGFGAGIIVACQVADRDFRKCNFCNGTGWYDYQNLDGTMSKERCGRCFGKGIISKTGKY